MVDKDIKSALVFYSIKDDSIFDMNIKDIWTKFIMSKAEGVRCLNVYHFELSTEELLTLFKSKDIPSELFSQIKSEYNSGANIMFINPVVGAPIDGFLLQKFFSN